MLSLITKKIEDGSGEFEMVVPKGTRSISGIAEEQFAFDEFGNVIEHRIGGAKQYWFNSVDNSWIK